MLTMEEKITGSEIPMIPVEKNENFSADKKVKIQTRGVNLHYGDFHALKGIEMTMQEKTVTALIGPSGCGKSTYLRLFNRMNDLIPNVKIDGFVMVDGKDIYERGVHVDELRKNVGMVFQKPNP